eukprot:COSAG04_NODE_345_length_16159_cov_5.383126_4_plen_118_part_00
MWKLFVALAADVGLTAAELNALPIDSDESIGQILAAITTRMIWEDAFTAAKAKDAAKCRFAPPRLATLSSLAAAHPLCLRRYGQFKNLMRGLGLGTISWADYKLGRAAIDAIGRAVR